ncbi:uncharacterized protein METZ01_LOCUS442150, partial [marine metagenome]
RLDSCNKRLFQKRASFRLATFSRHI